MDNKPAAVIPARCKNFLLFEKPLTYAPRDVVLYALGVGASTDPMDKKDLCFTYENDERFATIPSYACALTPISPLIDGLASCQGLPDFNPMMLLHGEEQLTLYKTLPTTTTDDDEQIPLMCKGYISNVEDKGSGALVNIVIDIEEQGRAGAASQIPICRIDRAFFIRGIGGFAPKTSKGEKPIDRPSSPHPKRAPDFVHTKTTTPNQALLYRLSGDVNPLHADPEMAQLGGFSKPILHGLCTFGICTHGVVREMCHNDPSGLLCIAGRFSKTVTPGDTVRVEMWRHDQTSASFRVINVTRNGEVCLTNGTAKFSAAPLSAL